MYGIAKGVDVNPYLDDGLTGDLDFEAIFDSTIQRISLGNINSAIKNKSTVHQNITFTGGSDESTAISFHGYNEGGSTGMYNNIILFETGTVTLGAGSYCFDWNVKGELNRGFNGYCYLYNTSGSLTNWYTADLSTTRSSMFQLSSQLVGKIVTRIGVAGEANAQSGCSVTPRLYYFGNPYAKMNKNSAVIVKPTGHSDAATYLSGHQEYALYYFPNGYIGDANINGALIGITPPCKEYPEITIGENTKLKFGISSAVSRFRSGTTWTTDYSAVSFFVQNENANGYKRIIPINTL